MSRFKRNPASYRDPSGFVFEQDGVYYRQVNKLYADHYQCFVSSGLYETLVKEKKILAHTIVDKNLTGDNNYYCTLLPEQLPFISFPYEWCFSQWKDAALLTLELVQKSLAYGMILKDATPFNIQFVNGAPVLIDSLSFEKYDDTEPWIAYHQFVQCFLAPLLLAKYRSADLLKIFQLYPDGIPLQLLSKLLPARSSFNFNIWLHIRLPNMLSVKQRSSEKSNTGFSRQKMKHLISNLYSFVQSLALAAVKTPWNDYYEETVLSKEYVGAKQKIIEDWLRQIPAQTVLDIGTNTGLFAKAAAHLGKFTIAADADAGCIERLYCECRKEKIQNLVPICIDIVNPTGGLGWENKERPGFLERAQLDLVLALALVHHLAISRDIGFDQMAALFNSLAPSLIIEFVPLDDTRTKWLLEKKTKAFDWYNESNFLDAFQVHFNLIKRTLVETTGRTIFLFQQK